MPRDYNEFAWHFRVLADAQKEGKLVFVLGSGVGSPYGLPDWSDLLADLLLDSGRLPRMAMRTECRQTANGKKGGKVEEDEEDGTIEKERKAVAAILQRLAPDPLIQGAIAHEAYPGNRLWDAIQGRLSSERMQQVLVERGHAVDLGSLAHSIPDSPLVRIARMLATSIGEHPNRHLSVLTFNYDSLLDEAVARELEKRGLDPRLLHSVSTEHRFEQTWLDAGVYIYHLHGHLSRKGTNVRSVPTVLDADSYVPVLRGDHWSWRCMERALTGTGQAALFIGLSIADPSLRYVLTRWGQWQTPVTGVYLAPPPLLPAFSYRKPEGGETHYVDDARALAVMHRAVMELYSAVLDRLHLVCYHLSSWDEIPQILDQVENRHGH
jgi:hypothetical protein